MVKTLVIEIKNWIIEIKTVSIAWESNPNSSRGAHEKINLSEEQIQINLITIKIKNYRIKISKRPSFWLGSVSQTYSLRDLITIVKKVHLALIILISFQLIHRLKITHKITWVLDLEHNLNPQTLIIKILSPWEQSKRTQITRGHTGGQC